MSSLWLLHQERGSHVNIEMLVILQILDTPSLDTSTPLMPTVKRVPQISALLNYGPKIQPDSRINLREPRLPLIHESFVLSTLVCAREIGQPIRTFDSSMVMDFEPE